jgi:hypothetical protein
MSLFLNWLSGIIKGIVALFAAYWAGKQAERSKQEAAQAKDAAEKQKDYATIATDETRDTIKDLKDGTF